MSRIGKFCLLFAGLFILAAGIVRLILNGWHDSMYFALGLAVTLFVVAIVKDIKYYLEFLTMRTTKHGMNMGALILLALVFLVTANFMAVRYDQKFDWTKEKLNSLSDQTVATLKKVDAEMKFMLLYRVQGESNNIKFEVGRTIKKYTDENRNVIFEAQSALRRPDLAEQYAFKSGDYGLFVEYKGKRAQVENTTEEEITKAMIKVTREKKSVVYFLTGHGELDMESATAPDGISEFKKQLAELYNIKSLTLFDRADVPADAALVAIIGPQQQLTETELSILRNYARRGGKLLVAADPASRHNLPLLLKPLGIEYQNNFLVDSKVFRAAPLLVLGTQFSNTSEITSKMVASGGFTQHLEVSALRKAPDAPSDFKFENLVSTDRGSAPVNEPPGNDEHVVAALRRAPGPHAFAVSVQGKLTSPMEKVAIASTEEPSEPQQGESGKEEFAAVVIGDSHFLMNQMFYQNLNRDLAMNSVAFLTKDTDLISIRPKRPAGTQLTLTDVQANLFLFGFLLPLPIALFFSGGFIWYRRRTA